MAWETLEQAGAVPDKLAGSQTGVFIGISSDDYSREPRKDRAQIDAYTGTGNAHSIAANRLSYTLDLRGPSMAIDTACSSSLVAVHQACLSLRHGECDLALAGGVNVILAPELTITFSQAGMMSSDGRCKTFDEAADGYVRSEGCGLVLLKPLANALRDGDRVLAILRGSAVNQDGRSNGLTAPNGPSQEAVIRRALQHAGVHPDDISYVETHGSSTPLGDPIEVDALKAVLMNERRPDQPCLLGAVKTNIGHLEAAAGIAGLIKTVLCLQKGKIAPNLHFKRLNPHISLTGTTFEIPTEPRAWPGQPHTPRFAGISAFGFGGTNVHVILEGAPQEEERRDSSESLWREAHRLQRLSERSVHLLTLSGRTAQALTVLAQRYRDFLVTHLTDRHEGRGQAPSLHLRDLCYTTNIGRTHFAHRLAIEAKNTEQMRQGLAAFVAGQIPKEMQVGHVGAGRGKAPALAFLFTGQGSQYVNMGRQLYETQPTFRQALDECDRLLRPLLPQPVGTDSDYSLLSLLYPVSSTLSPINETVYTQPALFALEYALAQMWFSWGIKPDVVMGHSVGEYVAACVAGHFSLEDGLKLITARGRLMQSLPEHGTMVTIEAPPEHLQAFIKPYEQQVALAALNGAQNTVIAGREEVIQLIVQHLEAEGMRTHLLSVSHAFHSPLMDPMLDAFEQVAREVAFAPLRMPLVCNLTGQLINAGEILDAHYWRRQTREAVQFAKGIQTLISNGYELFLELGPAPVLSNLGKRCLPVGVGLVPTQATWLSSLHQDHDDWHSIMQSVASLYCQGYNLNWSAFDAASLSHKTALPTYPFERAYYWFKSNETEGEDTRRDRESRENSVDAKDSHAIPGDPKDKSLIDFSLIFFSSNEASLGEEDYRLVIESARYADQHSFSAVWIPERHFTKEGWLYPNPAVLTSALARETSRIHLRAGSVVAPLHHPLRIAEDWAMVDKLSGGRVGVSFASGWHPNDFSLAPENYADRSEVMYRNIEMVRRLWRGESVPWKAGDGKLVELKTYPPPTQHEIPLWLTSAGSPATFANAGKLGANLLTHMYNQSLEELAEKIRLYRKARAASGYDPATGKVSVMLHTYIGVDMETVRAQIQGPFSHYLQSASYLVEAITSSRGQQIDLSHLPEQDLQDYLIFVTDRLIGEQRVLFGTPETCAPIVRQLQAVGVNEIACQMDFGIATDLVLRSLPYLNKLRVRSNTMGTAGMGAEPHTISADRTQVTSPVETGHSPSGRDKPLPLGTVPTRLKEERRNGKNGSNAWYDPTMSQTIPDASPPNEITNYLYQLRWEALDLPGSPQKMQPGHWLIFLDRKGIGQRLALQLQEQGHSSTLIEAGENFQTIDPHHYQASPAKPQEIKQCVRAALAAVHTLPLHGVIHLWSLDTTPVEALTLTALEADQILGVQSALSLIQALVEQAVQTRLWLITQGAQPVETTDTNLAVSQAPIWGLGKTCAMEHPELWGGLIDLDPHTESAQGTTPTAAPILTTLQGDWHEDQIALRGTKIYAARMVHVASALHEKPGLHISPDAAYLITGGLGGVGLSAALWLAMQGARHLILLGRTKLASRETWDQVPPESRQGQKIAGIRAIEQLGAQVHYVSIDVTDATQLAAVLSQWDRRDRALRRSDGYDNQHQKMPPIRGIMHTASVWQDAQDQPSGQARWLLRPLASLDVADLMTVLRPKLLGGWHLATTFHKTPLDFFVSFSSIASLFGSGALGNYAAANEFLGVLTHYQRAHGQPAICIDWGNISIGIGATPEGRFLYEYWASRGIGFLSREQFMAALDLLLQEDLTRVGVFKLDWQRLQQSYPQITDLPLVKQLVETEQKVMGTTQFRGTLASTHAGHDETGNQSEERSNGRRHVWQTERPAALESTPHHAMLAAYIQMQVANILRVPAYQLHREEPLTALGFDSLMAIELKNHIERDLQVHLPIMTLLQGPSTTQLVNQVLALQEGRGEADLIQREEPSGASASSNGGTGQSVVDGRHEPVEVPGSIQGMPLLSPASPAPVYLPLSSNQKALWFLFRLAPESAAYNMLYAVRIYGQCLDVAALQRALWVLAARYPILTSAYTLQDGEPVQQTRANQTIPLEENDASATSLDDLRLQLLEESNRPIDLTKGPVLRLILHRRDDDDYVLGFIVHHIAVDFWALELLVNELSSLYIIEKRGLTGTVGTGLAPVRVHIPTASDLWLQPDFQNDDYVHWQNAMLQSEEGERHWQYWQHVLSGDLPVLSLPTDRPRPPVQTYKGASHRFTLSTDLVTKLHALALIEKVTLFTLMLSAYQVLLHRYSHQDDILVGTPALGRTRASWERVIGYLANPVIVRARIEQNLPFKELLQQTNRGVLSALEHQDFPFALLAERLQLHRDPSYSPITQTHFIWDRPRTHNGEDLAHMRRGTREAGQEPRTVPTTPALFCSPFVYGQQGAPFDLTLTVFEIEDQLAADFRYNTDLFDASTIARMAKHFLTVLDSTVDNPEQYVQEIPLMSASEWYVLTQGTEQMMEWNTIQCNCQQDLYVHQFFEQQVEQTPDTIAVVFEGSKALTYRELNAQANHLAYDLSRVGVGPQELVGVCMDRSLEMVIALLGILKAGGTYVPLDPNYPQERLTYMLEDAQVSVVLIQTRRDSALRLSDGYTLRLPTTRNLPIALKTERSHCCHWSGGVGTWMGTTPVSTDTNPVKRLTPENLAYVIYTSGSTGRPKGAGVSHRSLINLLNWFRNDFHITAQDRALIVTSFSFDLTQKDLFAPLLVGGAVHLQSTDYDIALVRLSIAEQKITLLNCTPSMFYPLVDDSRNDAFEFLTSLRCVFLGGEPIALPQLWTWTHAPQCHAEIVNTYGPTECTDVVAFSRIEQYSQCVEAVVPIGHPIWNTQLLVLDENLQLVPPLVVGELYVAGTCVGAGYVHDAVLTAAKFLPNPFVGTTQTCSGDGAGHRIEARSYSACASRLYKTGDLARYRADGAIEYLGRIDHQVKLRGYRIELGEIEATLQAYPGVREAVVILREEDEKDKYLRAYVVMQHSDLPHLREELQSHLRKQLPGYMVPTSVVEFASLPLLPNGKVDRSALAAMDVAGESHQVRELASTPLQELLAIIWKDVLRLREVGIHENFFALGGHSLLATRVVARIRQTMQVDLPLRSLFEAPTIARLAKHLLELMREEPSLPVSPVRLVGSGLAPDHRLQPMERPVDLLLSFAQERLWFLHQWEPDSPWYNVATALRLAGRLSVAVLERSLARVVQRHEVLRTTFEERLGRPVQVIAPCGTERWMTMQVPVIDLGGLATAQRREQESQLQHAEAQRPFDLSRGPLLRICLLRLNSREAVGTGIPPIPQEHVLLFTLHHIVTDAWSMGVLVHEMTTLYQAEMKGEPGLLPQLPIQYADYAIFQRQFLQGLVSEQQRDYWCAQLAGLSPLDLPTDHPRPAVQSSQGPYKHSCFPPRS